ncbi:unnamed protein product [Psylliodes chrysocephalus]|uniref:Uncharacterized protein n=1 Tax=Psylliodes chrysocephalus TaxID=3402493 RepID=A0A9P0CZG5_9CUCU|nr:unnamed protein product [Psylliodes chrysocephala]
MMSKCNKNMPRAQYIVEMAKQQALEKEPDEDGGLIQESPFRLNRNQRILDWLHAESSNSNDNLYYHPPSIPQASILHTDDLTENDKQNGTLTELSPVVLEYFQDDVNSASNLVCSEKNNDGNFSDFSQDDDVEDPDFIPIDEGKQHKISSSVLVDVTEKATNTNYVGRRSDSASVEENDLQSPEENVQTNTSETDFNLETKIEKTRKRQRYEGKWQRNIKKQKINSGQEYISRLGKKHEAKKVLPPCDSAKCKYKCTKSICDADRRELFQKFYRLCDKTLQREYLARNIERIEPKNEKVYKKRQITCAYYFTTNNRKIRVCKLFFRNTLNISNNSIDTVLKKKNEFDFLTPEKRGTHSNRANKVDDALVKGVFDHINCFPRTESHYCRSSTSKEYLEGSLNISIMYRLYKEKCLETHQPFVKEHFYKEIFNTKFNLGFFKPKKDLCSVCETFKNLSEVEKENKKEAFQTHTKEKALARIEKDSDKNFALNDKNILLSAFDLQAVTPLPNGNVSTFYYKSKLNVFNFTLFNIPEKKGSYWKKISFLMGSNFNKNDEGDKVTWNEIKMIRVKKHETNKIFYKTSFTQDNFKVINIREKTRKKQIEKITLVPAYNKPPNIPNNKKEDLVSLCNDNLVPKRHHQFFMSLNGGTTANPDDSD